MFYVQQRRSLPLLSLCPENRSATITCCCFCRAPGAQIFGAEAILALQDGATQVCCWWLFMMALILPYSRNWYGVCQETLICQGHW